MLSILIPVFNFTIVELVEDLHQQAASAEIPFEIRCYDDGSESSIKQRNRTIQHWPSIIYRELPQNIGRSAIRNLLARDANQPYLLFNDCDIRTTSRNYILRYINFLKSTQEEKFVAYGGHTYPEHPPAQFNGLLHWAYGREKDVLYASARAQKPYLSFKTINFLLPKALVLENPFDENLTGYGHEDTLMALRFRQKSIPVFHMDNPVCHLGLVDNHTFLKKTTESVRNAAQLIKQGYITNELKLTRTYFWLQRLGLKRIGVKLFNRYKNTITTKLINERPSLPLLDLYKLGALLCFMSQVSEETSS